MLFNTALSLLEQGAVIADGHSVQGPGEHDRWIAGRKAAFSEPSREVINLDPGFPFAGSSV